MCKRKHESFKEYAQRWRDLVAQVAPPMMEREMITMIMDMSQPTLRREDNARLTGASSMGGKMRGVATNVYSRKTLEKPERCGLWTLSVKGLGVVFAHGEGISTPCVRHKGRQPLTKCAISCLRFVLFSFFCVFMSIYAFCIFYLFVVDKGVSLAPTYPQLRWGNQIYVVLCKSSKVTCWFYAFERSMLTDKSKEDRLRRWTLKRFLVIFVDKAWFVSWF